MAIVHRVGQPASEGERLLIRELQSTLSNDYIVYHNFEIPSGNGQFFEYDVVVVAPHAIYVIEDKYWHGVIKGNDSRIVLSSKTESNPLQQVSRQAKVLKNYLQSKNPLLRQVWIEDVINFSGRDVEIAVKGNSRSKMTTLKTISHYIQQDRVHTDRSRIRIPFDQLKNLVLEEMQTFQPIPEKKKRFHNYEEIYLEKQTELYNEYIVINKDVGSDKEYVLKEFFMDPYLSREEQEKQMHLLRNDFKKLEGMNDVKGVVKPITAFIPDGDNSRFCVVYQKIDGKSLMEYFLEEKQLSTEKVKDLFLKTVKILGEVHREGIIHRNLTPSNILVDQREQVILQNFEFSRLVDPSSQTTIMTEALSEGLDRRYTPGKVLTSHNLASPASDLYSIGRIYYDLLAGNDQNNPERENGRLPAIQGVADEELMNVITKMCHHHVKEWYESADEILDMLEEQKEEEPSQEEKQVMETPEIYEVGSEIDSRYKILKRLGQGGTSNVYQAFYVPTEETFAIKVMKNSQISNINVVRKEYQRLRTINHPHIAKVYDVDSVHQGQQYLLKMEYIEGKSMQQLFDEQNSFSILQVIKWARELLDALIYLQNLEIPIIHADIKPANIMVRDGKTLLIDFNISRDADQSTIIGGTTRYLAPDVHEIGAKPSLDTFSLGIVLYELLSNGEYPFEDSMPDLGDSPKLLREFRPTVSEALSQWVEKACQPYHNDRFKTPQEMLEALDTIESYYSEIKVKLPTYDFSAIKPYPEQINSQYDNYLIPHFQSLYSQSPISNKGTRGLDPFAKINYVETKLENTLLQKIADGSFQLVIITGNAGDGKTAFIQNLEYQLLDKEGKLIEDKDNGKVIDFRGIRLITNYDGSQDEGDKLNEDVLDEFFDAFAGENPFSPQSGDRKEVRLIAINEGRLMEFLSSHDEKYRVLLQRIESYLRLRENEETEFSLVNLNWRSVVARDELSPSILEKLIDKFSDPQITEQCGTCKSKEICPIYYNLTSLQDEAVGPQIKENIRKVVETVHFRKKLHITMRDIRSSLSYILYGTMNCRDIEKLGRYASVDNSRKLLTGYYYNAIFNMGNSVDRLMMELGKVDVSEVSVPHIENTLASQSSSDQELYAIKDLSYHPKDTDLLDVLFQQRPIQPTELMEVDKVEAFKAFVSISKRKYYFESLDNDPYILLPYPSLKRFKRLLEGKVNPESELSEVLQAISTSEGVHHAYTKDKLALKESKWNRADFISLRIFPRENFTLKIQDLGQETQFIEYSPDMIQLRYHSSEQGKRIMLDLTLDLYELLQKVKNGYVPSTYELRGGFMNLTIFKTQLLSQTYNELVLIEKNKDLYKVKKADGKLSLFALEGGEQLEEYRKES
ncbi:protein kinase domain-containing protein [Niallia sp. Krafla_26]|uniref:protein kinase domain-containing protein n=1 Tax=Niallia sp. Krafla_26 TaxID=3064703 RepID=UPI003D17F2B3